jgi:formyltetrahydrofolate hydrolase
VSERIEQSPWSPPPDVRLGADIERTVLARAVQWHCEDRVLRAGATTVVF